MQFEYRVENEWRQVRQCTRIERLRVNNAHGHEEGGGGQKDDAGGEEMSLKGRFKYKQRLCDSWLKAFSPWLTRSHDDANKPYCKACQTHLDCNRCHLQRHERTTKHHRNLIQLLKGETIKPTLSIRRERSKYYQPREPASVASSIVEANASDCDQSDIEVEETDPADKDQGRDGMVAIQRLEEEGLAHEVKQEADNLDNHYEFESIVQGDGGAMETPTVTGVHDDNTMSLLNSEYSMESEQDINTAIVYEKCENLDLGSQHHNMQYELDNSTTYSYILEDNAVTDVQRQEATMHKDVTIEEQQQPAAFPSHEEQHISPSTPYLFNIRNTLTSSSSQAFKEQCGQIQMPTKTLLVANKRLAQEKLGSDCDVEGVRSFGQPEKNHVDLFFESVSSSVKALSPKLIAETKLRVSQLICELELRALKERETAQVNMVHSLPHPHSNIKMSSSLLSNGRSTRGQ